MSSTQVDVSPSDILPRDVVLSLHDHPLALIDTQKRKDAMALLGLSKSFVCKNCGQLRHRFIRMCQSCDVRVCQPCYQAALAEQTTILSQAIQDHQASTSSPVGASGSVVATSSSHETKDKRPPIVVGCITGNYALVRELVEKNDFSGTLDLEQVCDVDDGGPKGRTLLLLSAEFGHRAIVMLLMARGANANACDNRGMTPLMHAAFGGHVEVVDELLFGGVAVDQTAFCGYTALLFATNRGHTLCVERLIAAGASPTARTPKGRTPLIVAALNGHLSTVHMLLKHLSSVELCDVDFEGYNAVDAAVARGHAHVEKVLRERWSR